MSCRKQLCYMFRYCVRGPRGGGWGNIVDETKPDHKIRGDFYTHSIKHTTRKWWEVSWGWEIKIEACWRCVFTVGYVRGDANTLQQRLRLPPLPLQVGVFMAGRRPTARLRSTLWISLQRTEYIQPNSSMRAYHNIQQPKTNELKQSRQVLDLCN